ncbi:MAG: quinolinate synthase NadA [Proteobacteria bacterium]|nr:quinolinate synthase NadA [Pseudomonadota bacterium]
MSGVSDLHKKIDALKKKRNAVLLAHNYQLPEVQDIADFSGDSLELSRKAAATDADVIVFCGVHFMAETAALLSPDKTVLLPDQKAGCPMADMIEAADVIELRLAHPGAVVVCYVNSSAVVKAESDVCCTSANAVDIVNRIPGDRDIIFIPDQYLGKHAAKITGREIISFKGHCPTHVRLLPEHVENARKQYPNAPVIVHPESRPDVCDLADDVLSTGGMVRFSLETAAKQVVVGTETGLLHRLRNENPGKEFIPLLKRAVCPNMKRINLEKIVWSLEELQHKVEVTGAEAEKAKEAILAMLGDGPIVGRE